MPGPLSSGVHEQTEIGPGHLQRLVRRRHRSRTLADLRNGKAPADFTRQVRPQGMAAALALEGTAVLAQVLQQAGSFHSTVTVSRIASGTFCERGGGIGGTGRIAGRLWRHGRVRSQERTGAAAGPGADAGSWSITTAQVYPCLGRASTPFAWSCCRPWAAFSKRTPLCHEFA